ncbi:hypothetical protein NQ318_016202, partial [Aromia moschata]
NATASHEHVTEKSEDEEEVHSEEVTEANFPYQSAFNSDIQRFHFPHNLQIVGELLKKLKNHDCVRDTTVGLEGMTRHERWALEMFDSFPKFPVGILYGNHYQLGNFDECVGVKHSFQVDNNETETIIRGQYCLADIHFKNRNGHGGRPARTIHDKKPRPNRSKYNNTVIHWGICLPSSCTTEDAQVFVQEIFSSAVENFEVTSVQIEASKCYYEHSLAITSSEIVYGITSLYSCVIGAFVIFTALATGYHCWYLRNRKFYATYNVDALRTRKPTALQEVLICFSCIRSIEKFLETKPNELNLECICGIKLISMTLIIVGHSLIFIFGGPVVNRNFFEETSTKLENGPFLNNVLLVDTFLLVSGFLMCRLLLIELEKRKGQINVAVLYIARYIRLTPAYIVVIGLYTTFLSRAGSGPLWESRIGLEKERCVNSWWTNILYINNYVNTEQLCMFQSWYLAVDYHMFVIASYNLPIVEMEENRDNLDPTFMAYPPEITDISTNSYFVNTYIKTHIRSSSYFIGLLFGYLVHRLQSSGAKIKSYIIWLAWTLAAILGVMSMYTIVIFYNPDHEANSFESAIYSSLHRVAWCLAIGWIMLACITENAAIINKFLSWKFFIPTSRLTYCAYLANGIIEVYNMAVLRQPMYLSKYELACKILGHLILTYTVAFLLCILFESPIHGLEKMLLRKEKVKEHKHTPSSTLKPVEES